MDVTTDSLRALAPKWNLAGDDRLLTLLQNTHQKIVTKCREVNSRLDEMTSALDVASISLQNVNNKLMALSNSQFIESRVYEDDGDVADVKPTEDPPSPEAVDEIYLLKRGLAILDNAHETAEILDESDTDSGAEISVVLKQKDLYSRRPLPYIIGSLPWKTKWHAGLVAEDSDSDSSCPTREREEEREEYSASDDDALTHGPMHDHTISETSSFSERDMSRERDTVSRDRDRDTCRDTDTAKKQSPADVAAELAARLGQVPPRVPEEPETYRQPTIKPVYRPQNPVTSTIFSDEPPPVDNDRHSSDSADDDDDIFAEINKRQPYNNSNKSYVDDLFGKPAQGYNKEETTGAKRKSTLFDGESEPDLFADAPQNTKDTCKVVESGESVVKKPVGGISLFGSNKGTESIGAAILNRNRRKSSTSGSESDENTIKTDTADKRKSSEDTDKSNANAMFDNLFAKAKQAEQKTIKPMKAAEKKTPEKPKQNVKDLFSDNIFDDIDDIFTSNIKIPSKEDSKNAKSIFDDDDDLFSDITKSNTITTGVRSNKKIIFDSDDELFSEMKGSKNNNVDKITENLKESQTKNGPEFNNNTTESVETKESAVFNKPPPKVEEPKVKSQSIFDSDSDDGIFSNIMIKKNENTQEFHQSINTDHKTETKSIKDHLKTKKVDNLMTDTAKILQSPSLFEEDEIDDLFINANKTKIPANATPTNTCNEITGIDICIKNSEKILENNIKDEKEISETCQYIQENIEIKKPVIVDTKPYIFPKIDETETSHKLFDKDVDTNNAFVRSKKILESYNKSSSHEDIIDASHDIETMKVQSKRSSLVVDIEPKITKLDFDVTNKTDYDNKTDKEEKTLYDVSNANIPDVNNELKINEEDKRDTVIKRDPISATFDDIFSEPPAFEKTKESKKSSNVNALFEDDSDDEALFFKKNDVISDEKPNLFSPSANFAIFNDEPPALDECRSKQDNFDDDNDIFSSASTKQTNAISNEPIVNDWDDNTLLPDQNTPHKTTDDIIESDIFSSQETAKSEITAVKPNGKEVLDSDDELFLNLTKTSQKHEKPKEIKETEKKIGKINTKNFNINVQALVPGASPKKIPKNVTEDKDTEYLETVTEVDNAEPKMVKSISFEDKPDSGVLDNNVSKQRPRIQVKRRPSSRRARHEAVRKSVLVDDDTDNSSSFDEPKPRPRTMDLDKESKVESMLSQNQEIIKVKNTESAETSCDDNVQNLNDSLKSDVIDKKDEIFLIPDEITESLNKHGSDVTDSVTSKYVDRTATEIIQDIAAPSIEDSTKNKKLVGQTQNKDVKEVKSPESTTKVVYILNDEDIFSQEKPKEKLEDDLFTNKEINEDNLFKNRGITTIGSTYKEIAPTKAQSIHTAKASSEKVQPKPKSLFDLSDDDDDLFGKNKKPLKAETKPKLFESDSEEELFGGKKETKQKKTETVKVAEVKKVSLFGDDDDGDLFGAKTKTTNPNRQFSSKPVQKEGQTTELAFEDPLSMFD